MDEPKIDLRQFHPKKASKLYLIKVVVYTGVLFGLIWFITKKLEENSKKSENNVEVIDRVEVQIK
jgi:hypothetical protein